MDQDKLEGAPVHNLDAERSVGFINYELSIRGSKQLSSASSTQVECAAHDLIDNTVPGSYKEYSKVAKYVIPELCLKWAAKQEDLKKKGLVDKEIANVALDRRKTKDLEKLKCMGGPFTMSSQVDEYLKSDDSNKVARLYIEVRYARDTSLSMPKNSDIFRLMKDHRRLSEETYATNLKLYLDNVVSIADVTMDDFDRAIDTFTQHD